MKRLLSLILCLMMLVSLMPNAAFADDAAAGAETALTEEVPADEEPAEGEETPAEEEPAEETPADEEVPAEETPADEEPAEDDIEAESEEDIEALAETASGTCGDKLTWALTDDGVLTVSGTGAMTDWDSDSSTPPWDPYSDSIKSVVISSGVTSIGGYAFSQCSSLTSVSIPDSVTNISNRAFGWCSSLTSVTIPNSVTSIGECAFISCDGLTSVTIPSGVTSIGDSAFNWCNSLTAINVAADNANFCSVNGVLFNKAKTELITCPAGKSGAYTIPSGVTDIECEAFVSCYGLTSVTIPDSVTSIGAAAFAWCRSLTSVTLPSGLTSIEQEVFCECCSLTSVTIPSSVTSIGKYVFSYCSSLTSVTIPSSVTSIGEGAFNGCSSLTRITIPGSVTGIGEAAFSYCSSLTSVTIPSSVTSIGEGAFNCCSSLTSVTIPDSVTSIDWGAFSGCSSLTSITIPSSVTSIGEYAFYNCTGLTEIIFEGNAPMIGEFAFGRVAATAYYPESNTTWTDDVKQDYGGTITWKAYGAPVITGAYNYADYIKVVWNAVEGAAKYRLLYRKGTGDWVTVCDTTSTRVNITDVEDGASYTFVVVCVSADGKTLTSDYSNRASQIRLTTPAVTVSRFGKVGSVDGSGFKVSWDAVEGGSCYKVYYREKGGSWALYANYAKSNNTRYVNIKSSQTNASTTAGEKFPDLVIGHTYEFTVITATSQAGITSGFPTTYTGYKF